MTKPNQLDEDIRKALQEDFEKLYVKEFTLDYKTQRVLRNLEIRIMSLDNIKSLIAKAQKEAMTTIKLGDIVLSKEKQ